MSLGVPPLIVYAYTGLMHSTYSNMDEAWEQFWNTTMSSQLKDLRAWLTMTLLREFESKDAIRGEMVRVGWDLSEVGALQEDQTAAEGRLISKWEKGLITMDESRKQVGLPPHPDPVYGALNFFELQALANALAGTAAVAALDSGLKGGGYPGSLDGRIGDVEWGLASLSGRINRLATTDGHDPDGAATVLLSNGRDNGETNE